MGVNRALSLCSELILKKVKPIFSLGPIIHNSDVINKLNEQGVLVEENVSKMPEDACVLIRTHGITPELRSDLKNKVYKICDATCPKVAKVQGIIRQHVDAAYHVLIIGDHEHAETKALIAYTKGNGTIVSNEKELWSFINTIEPEENICVVAQTTQDLELFDKLCVILRNNFINLKIINTICEATRHRQDELKKEADNYDRIIVVGGKNSANTTRLFEIAKASKAKIINHIENVSELEKPTKDERIFITAGASTPLSSIYEIKKKIMDELFFQKIINFLGSQFLYNSVAISSIIIFAVFNIYNKALLAGLIYLAGIGVQRYHQKKIDMLFQKEFKALLYVVFALLVFYALNVNFKNIFFLFYYLVLIFVIYINPIINREVIRLFCTFLFILLPLI